MIRANVTLTKKQESCFRTLATENGLTMSGYLRYLVVQHLKRVKREEEAYAAAKEN